MTVLAPKTANAVYLLALLIASNEIISSSGMDFSLTIDAFGNVFVGEASVCLQISQVDVVAILACHL